jgi:hypothetical protein
MTIPTRVAGWGTTADGSTVTWTVSEGRRGRRWREVVAREGGVVHALLLETDPDGRFSHLELARADGLWTFHPERDGSLHGNHVDRSEAGVRHVEGWPFHSEDAIVIDHSPLSLAATAHRCRDLDGAVIVGAVVIRANGVLDRLESVRIERRSPTLWTVGAWQVEIDDAGLPLLQGGTMRPLEVDR